MVIYVRTEEGQLAAYGRDSAIPRKLRSLLKLVDGKTSLNVYSNNLQAFGDVHGILRSLDMAGLIRPLSLVSSTQVASEADTLPASLAPALTIPAKPNLFSSPAEYALSTQFEHTQSAFALTRSASSATDAGRAQALAHAVDTMSNFILTHAPEHAFVALKELESLPNLEALAVTLGGYQQLISHLGAVSQEHTAYIKQLLHDHM
jgi:hypothetical protein